MAQLLQGHTLLKLKQQGPVTASVGLSNSMLGLFFGREYVVVRWQSGEVVVEGRTLQQLSEVVPHNSLTVAAFNIAKASLDLLNLENGETLHSVHINFRNTECVNSLMSFGDTDLAVLSRTATDSFLSYFDKQLQAVKQHQFSAMHVFDKLDERSGVAAYIQDVRGGTVTIYMLEAGTAPTSVTVSNIEQEESLLQRVWKLSQQELLLGFNHRNRCFWEVRNTTLNERTFRIDHLCLIEDALLLDATTSQTFTFLSVKKQLKNEKAIALIYTDSYKGPAITFEKLVDCTGDYNLVDRRTIVFIKKGQDNTVILQSLRAVSKQNYYLHLLKSVGAISRYGTAIGRACTNHLSGDN